jgi:CBS domain-containing protein
MRIDETRRRSAVAVQPDDTIAATAEVMDRAGVGAVAVIEDGRPVGIVTDRDLVRRGLARHLAADARVDGVMTSPVLGVRGDEDVRAAFPLFRRHAVRRLAVVDAEGRFTGMLTVDDLLIDLAADLNDITRPVTAETIFGHHDSPVPAVT